MSVYARRFLTDPGDAVLLNIESVNILDLTPPASIQGIGTGTVILVGEFENGPYNTPQQLLGVTDLTRTWGTLGYTYGGLVAQYPSAPVRFADSAMAPEYWNGNGFVQISGQTYASLIFVRVDTSVGSVQFEQLAFVEGASEFAYTLQSGQALELTLYPYSTTTAQGGTLPLSTINVESTAGFPASGTFLLDGQSITYASITPTAFLGCSGGSGSFNPGDLVTTSSPSVETATFTGVAATVTGFSGTSGFAGGETMIAAIDGVPSFTVTFLASDQTPAQVAARINQYAGFQLASVPSGSLVLNGTVAGLAGSINIIGGTGISDIGLSAGITNGTGNVQNINQIKFSELQSIITTAMSSLVRVEQNPSQQIRISYVANPGIGGMAVTAGTTATGLGFTVGQYDSAGSNAGGTLPAGTVVTDGASTILVTTQDLVIPPDTIGPYSVPVRFAVDDGSGVGVVANSISTIPNPPAIGSFSVTNFAAINNALTESQIDAAYATAIATTTDVNSVAKVANLIVSARQSNTVRSQLRTNALYASANGCYGRMACISPPLNTPPQTALSTIAAPGVGATRDQRVIYCYVGFNVFVPLIGQVGLAGGTGFTATGNVDVHSDTWMASICSQLPPEENPGQETTFTANVNGLETGPNVQGFDINDYIAFKAAGIAAARIDDGVAIFQSGVTSVDPSVYPQLTRISRRRMADYIEDSIQLAAKPFGKKLSLQARRKALKNEIRGFMAGLLSKNNPGAQRIAGYTVSDADDNTDTTLSQGMYRITVNARTLASLDSIVVATTVGEDVDVTEVLPQNQ